MHCPDARGSADEGRSLVVSRRRAAFGWCAAVAIGALTVGTGRSVAADISVTSAWVPPTEAAGADVVLSMTVKNAGDEDSILRARCPFANFVEKQTVDVGEGGTSNRTIKSIPIPAKSMLEMTSKGYHLMLLQTTEKLAEGGKYSCSVTFKGAGPTDVEVKVAKTAPAS